MRLITLALTLTLIASSAIVAATASDVTQDPTLGTDGTFANRAGQDWFREQQRITDILAAEHALARLHLMDDDADARMTAEELEQIAALLTDPRTLDLLESSHYYRAVIQGHAPTTH